MSSNKMFERLELIASVTSRSQKQMMLLGAVTDHPGLLKVLRYAYDPYKKYHVVSKLTSGVGAGQLKTSHLVLLERLAARDITGHDAIHTVNTAIAAMSPASALLFKRILRKDLRIGMSAILINQALGQKLIPIHKFMKGQPIIDARNNIDNWHRVRYPCIATLKIDGIRGMKRQDKFYFSGGKEIPGLQHLQEQLGGPVPMDVEIRCPELDFWQNSGHIRSYNASPTAIAYMLELPEHRSNSRIQRLTDMAELCRCLTHVKVVPWWICKNKTDVLTRFKWARDNNYEGIVVNPLKYDYEHKRSFHWLKVKAIESEDLEVIDIYEGEGRLADSLGGIVVDFGGVPVRVGSGFSDVLRERIWADPYFAIGRIVEILYHEVTPDGSLREPRFLRFRDDKEEA